MAKRFACYGYAYSASALRKTIQRQNWYGACFWYSEFDRTDEISPCSVLPVLYPQKEHLTLAQKLFRREPAISRFD